MSIVVTNIGTFQSGTGNGETQWGWGEFDSPQFWPPGTVVVQFLIDIWHPGALQAGTGNGETQRGWGQFYGPQFRPPGAIVVQFLIDVRDPLSF